MSHATVLVSSLQSHFGTGHSGIDLLIGMVLTSAVMYLAQHVPVHAKALFAAFFAWLYPPRIKKVEWKHTINIRDTTSTDVRSNGTRHLGQRHSLIIHGVIQRLQNEDVVRCSDQVSVALMHQEGTATSSNDRMLAMYTSVFPETPVTYLGMEFEFKRHTPKEAESKSDKSVVVSTFAGASDPQLDLIVRSNSYDKAIKFIEQCRVEEVHRSFPSKDANRAKQIYTMLQRQSYRAAPFEAQKTFNSIFFDQKNKLISLVNDFSERKGAWAPRLERSYKLVILMHSRPGTGKSSILKALANHTNREIVIANPSYCRSNEDLGALFTDVDLPSSNQRYWVPLNKRILVMEDLDCNGCDELLQRKTEKVDKSIGSLLKSKSGKSNSVPLLSNGPTFSGFLNVLDGVVEPTGLIVVMTTNDISAFDPTLIRPGRVDCLLELGSLSLSSATEMIQFYRPESDKAEVERVGKAVIDNQMLPCDLQEVMQWTDPLVTIAEKLEQKIKAEPIKAELTIAEKLEQIIQAEPINNAKITIAEKLEQKINADSIKAEPTIAEKAEPIKGLVDRLSEPLISTEITVDGDGKVNVVIAPIKLVLDESSEDEDYPYEEDYGRDGYDDGAEDQDNLLFDNVGVSGYTNTGDGAEIYGNVQIQAIAKVQADTTVQEDMECDYVESVANGRNNVLKVSASSYPTIHTLRSTIG